MIVNLFLVYVLVVLEEVLVKDYISVCVLVLLLSHVPLELKLLQHCRLLVRVKVEANFNRKW